MSFILDALKKSEAERQRKSVPGFADIPDGRNSSAPRRWWLWAIGSLLAVNLAVLLGMYFRPGITQALVPAMQEQETLPAALPQRDSAPVVARTEQPVANVVIDAPPANTAENLQATTEAPRTAPPQPTARQQAPAAVEPGRGTTTMGEALPTLQDVRADGTLQLPDLHLDIHVYSETPAERFVFINMTRYNERAALAEGPIVKEIMPEGVLLEHRGTRFLLPRR